jgi:hypothetical protein
MDSIKALGPQKGKWASPNIAEDRVRATGEFETFSIIRNTTLRKNISSENPAAAV